jgi:DNA-directed RNA polymerase specialized sigma24 family protein
MPPSDDDAPAPKQRKAPRELRPAVRAFLSRKDVWQFVHDYVKRRVPRTEYEQVAQDALMEATANAVWPDTGEEKVLWATLTTVTDRGIADHLEKRKRRREYEGDMPPDPTIQDEAGDYVPDEERDRDPSADPRVPVPRVEGTIMRRYLAQAVKGKPRDEETLRWMTLWADEEKTYDDVARETGLPVTTVSKRVHDFKEEYGPRYTRWRNRTLLFLLLVGAAILAYLVSRPKPDAIRPAPDFTWPPPSASSSAPVLPPPPPTFDNALPTQPDAPLKPQP